MLIIDGVKYEEWTPPSEDEFENVVKEHAKGIFGKDSKYFDLKHRLASRSGTGSIPDGYVITLGDKPEVQIIELELASHSLQHIVSQMVNIINGIENPTTQQRICNAIEDGINEDEIFATKIAKAIKPVSVHRYLLDSFSNKLPIINIIIDKSSPVLDEAISKITPLPRIIEFQTFTREGVGLAVHAHLFQPLYKHVEPPRVMRPLVPETQKLEHTLTQRDLKMKRFRIPKRDKRFFPPPYVDFELMTDVGIVKTNGRGHGDPLFIQRNLREWFRKHQDLKAGNEVTFKVIEPMKRYRLEIVK